ncbi:hypothetical protein [Psychrobacter sp. DAB_AL43B]|uniref:hypothetical protein n=1 Tax=Psychrobacter sp. DAB_AL43B TaxID=1028416 RepID=UPI0009A624E2|nr:hypothetical protein [Psychrobacter sp. DAB_AL43B]SLJ83903.1 hypothetical protein DABAL43B_0702 [Psychrobacter sp. DAB_AL43B]
MLIPKYWAQDKQRFELRETPNKPARQATIKRYGWSDISQSEALSHAKARVDEAHKCWLAGEDILRRERREEYNASNGIPIREQIISEHSFPESGLLNNNAAATQLIVTRNSYGAQVANVDNIAIIDVDNDQLLHYKYPERYDHHGFMPALPIDESIPLAKVKIWFFIFLFILIASVIAWLGVSWLWLLAVMFGATAYLWQQASARDKVWSQKYSDDAASLLPYMTNLIKKRITSHPNESFRLYQTPAGFRIIATHDIVSPSNSVVEEWFAYFHADTNYVHLCQVQQCFRARLTAKPWRMNEVENNNLAKDIPAKDFWFSFEDTDVERSIEQREDALKARKQWIADYDNYAKNYRACHYVESIIGKEAANNSKAQASIDDFVRWHDRACQVNKGLEMA